MHLDPLKAARRKAAEAATGGIPAVPGPYIVPEPAANIGPAIDPPPAGNPLLRSRSPGQRPAGGPAATRPAAGARRHGAREARCRGLPFAAIGGKVGTGDPGQSRRQDPAHRLQPRRCPAIDKDTEPKEHSAIRPNPARGRTRTAACRSIRSRKTARSSSIGPSPSWRW